MTEFSTLVYRCPGPHQCPGGTFDWQQAKSQEELDELIGDGWFRTMPEAMSGKHAVDDDAPPEVEDETVDDDAPPTREELEIQANSLGIEFDGRTSDRKLMQRIDEALEA